MQSPPGCHAEYQDGSGADAIVFIPFWPGLGRPVCRPPIRSRLAAARPASLAAALGAGVSYHHSRRLRPAPCRAPLHMAAATAAAAAAAACMPLLQAAGAGAPRAQQSGSAQRRRSRSPRPANVNRRRRPPPSAALLPPQCLLGPGGPASICRVPRPAGGVGDEGSAGCRA
jgi:hypothetical protein